MRLVQLYKLQEQHTRLTRSIKKIKKSLKVTSLWLFQYCYTYVIIHQNFASLKMAFSLINHQGIYNNSKAWR